MNHTPPRENGWYPTEKFGKLEILPVVDGFVREHGYWLVLEKSSRLWGERTAVEVPVPVRI